MNLQDTAMDNMNRIATDIKECEKCDSENIEMIESHYNGEIREEIYKCKDCGVAFKDYS